MRITDRRIAALEARLLPKSADLGWLIPWRDDVESIAEAEARFIRQHGRLPDRGYIVAPIPLTEDEWIRRYSPD